MAATRNLVDRIQTLQGSPDRLRSICVIAHVDHGKSTLSDSLLSGVAGGGLIDSERAGTQRLMDTRDDEKERGITIKSTGATGFYEVPNYETGETESFAINLVDTPGHVDFSSEVTAALRICDGAIVVIDAAEGVSVQTQTVLRQALSELVRPVWCINKIDRYISELQLTPEEAYLRFAAIVDSANSLLDTFRDAAAADEAPPPAAADAAASAAQDAAAAVKAARAEASRTFTSQLSMDPRLGSVVFACGKQGWAFSLEAVARQCVARYGSTVAKWMPKLWGDWWWDAAERKFVKSPVAPGTGASLPRAFCHFVLQPIWDLYRAVRVNAGEGAEALLEAAGVAMKAADYAQMREDHEYAAFFEKAMRRWMPASTALVQLAVRHLPSPVVAQAYRTAVLYEGPVDDECARAMRACDPAGPLMMFVSKMVPVDHGMMAFGRVFSGTLRNGETVRIISPEHDAGTAAQAHSAKISRVVIWMAARQEGVDAVPCGNTAGIQGIEKWLVKTGTITTSPSAHAIAPLRMSVSPVVRVAVRPKNPADIKAFREGLIKLNRADSMVVISRDQATDQDILAGVGKLHLEICLADLEKLFARVPIVAEPPVVSYRETVLAACPEPVLKKSSNKHNRLWMTAQPLPTGFAEAVDSGVLADSGERRELVRLLCDNYGFDKDEAKAMWVFGGPTAESSANVLINASKSVAYVQEASTAISDGYREAIAAGPLCGEPVRGVRIAFTDGQFHSDSPHRAPRFVTGAARSAIWGAMLCAQPRLLEPVYEATIVAPPEALGAIYSVLAPRRAILIGQGPKEGTPLIVVTAHLPVATSFDFHEALLDATSGKAFPSLSFSHWALIDSDPLVPGTEANDIVRAVRQRNRLPEALPTLADLSDRL